MFDPIMTQKQLYQLKLGVNKAITKSILQNLNATF